MDLENKTSEELRALAKELNIKVHHKASDETVIKQINSQQPHRVDGVAKNMEAKYARKVEQEHENTIEEVREALDRLTLPDDFQAKFNRDENTWWFKYNGAEDSGNLNIPLRLIVSAAVQVAKGRRALLAMGKDVGDPTYAGTIIRAG
jgi:hypothetical protein